MTGSAPFGCWGCVIAPRERWKCLDRSAGRYDRHHLIPQQILRREYRHGHNGRSLDDLLADERNIVQVGRWHHAQIEAHMLNPQWRDLPAAAVEFAAELGLAHLLERRYPMLRRADDCIVSANAQLDESGTVTVAIRAARR